MGYAKASQILSMLQNLLLYAVIDTVNAQTGFTSLMCGAPSDYLSQSNGIFWTSDAAYAPPISKNFSLATHSTLMTLRSFPPDVSSPSGRSCYSDLVPAGLGLVRATFTYRNYDGLNNPPVFGVSIGATMYSTIDFKMQDPWVEEVILNATDAQAFCLIALNGIPVISLLELRPLPSGSYTHASSSSVLLKKVHRLDCGSDAMQFARYPDDNCDRIWDPDVYYLDPSTTSTHSITHLLNTSAVADVAPMIVLQSNRFNYHNLTLSYSLPLVKPTGKYLMNTYFGELYNTTSSSFKVSVNGAILLSVNGWPPLSAVELTLTQAADWWWNVSLLPVTGSPQINGLEILEIVQMKHTSNSKDARALKLIELNFNVQSVLLDWAFGSDPCFPVPWRGVICDPEGMITALDLSSSQLSGDITGLFQDFTSLEHLNASGNSLTGNIKDFKGRFQSLKMIDLSNNQLSGTLDAFVALNLQYLNVANNQFSGAIPKQLEHPGLVLITSGNLCLIQHGIDPCAPVVTSQTPHPHPVEIEPMKSARHKPKSIVMGASIGSTMAVIAVAAAGIICCRSYKLKRELIDASEEAGTVNILEKELEFDNNVKRYSFQEIENATYHFKETLGEGSLGPVYRGRLSDGTDVAIKMRSDGLQLNPDTFLNEVSFLSKLHHQNLVLLKGYCLECKKQFLVFEFMSGGSLKDHLYGPLSKLQSMTWEQRLASAMGAAAGLEYLHSSGNSKIIHRNLKSSNILLGANYLAKVSDFVLIKPVTNAQKILIRGTAGYLDPEYFNTAELTDKSDVFSFGVVLMEILCGREPLSSDCAPDAYNLVAWVRPALQNSIPKGDTSVIDKTLANMFVQQSLAIVANIAVQCTEKEGSNRPSMTEVIKELKRAIDVEDLLPTSITEPSPPKKTLPPAPKSINKQHKIFHPQEIYPAQRSQNITFRVR